MFAHPAPLHANGGLGRRESQGSVSSAGSLDLVSPCLPLALRPPIHEATCPHGAGALQTRVQASEMGKVLLQRQAHLCVCLEICSHSVAVFVSVFLILT